MSLNLLFAFLWREWRDSPQMKTFFLKKMNSEFTDLIQGKAARKVIEQITIEELSLGTSLPVITGLYDMNICSVYIKFLYDCMTIINIQIKVTHLIRVKLNANNALKWILIQYSIHKSFLKIHSARLLTNRINLGFCPSFLLIILWNRDGTVVKALISHQCSPCSVNSWTSSHSCSEGFNPSSLVFPNATAK